MQKTVWESVEGKLDKNKFEPTWFKKHGLTDPYKKFLRVP